MMILHGDMGCQRTEGRSTEIRESLSTWMAKILVKNHHKPTMLGIFESLRQLALIWYKSHIHIFYCSELRAKKVRLILNAVTVLTPTF